MGLIAFKKKGSYVALPCIVAVYEQEMRNCTSKLLYFFTHIEGFSTC